MVTVEGNEFPTNLLYDLENQIWYEAVAEDAVRAGFTPLAMSLAGEVLVFTPKRIGRPFQRNRSFATIECGKWVGAARAAFDGTVVASNEQLIRQPQLLNSDAFGEGWMLLVRPTDGDWGRCLVTGVDVGPAFAEWISAEPYRNRTE